MSCTFLFLHPHVCWFGGLGFSLVCGMGLGVVWVLRWGYFVYHVFCGWCWAGCRWVSLLSSSMMRVGSLIGPCFVRALSLVFGGSCSDFCSLGGPLSPGWGFSSCASVFGGGCSSEASLSPGGGGGGGCLRWGFYAFFLVLLWGSGVCMGFFVGFYGVSCTGGCGDELGCLTVFGTLS